MPLENEKDKITNDPDKCVGKKRGIPVNWARLECTASRKGDAAKQLERHRY